MRLPRGCHGLDGNRGKCSGLMKCNERRRFENWYQEETLIRMVPMRTNVHFDFFNHRPLRLYRSCPSSDHPSFALILAHG